MLTCTTENEFLSRLPRECLTSSVKIENLP